MPEVSIQFLMGMKVASLEKEGPVGEVGKALEQLSQFLKEKISGLLAPPWVCSMMIQKTFNPRKRGTKSAFPYPENSKKKEGAK